MRTSHVSAVSVVTAASLLLALGLASACGKKDPTSAPAAEPAPTSAAPATAPATAPAAAAPAGDAAAEAKQLFDTVCAMCHGPTGKGDGQASAALNPKPRNYSDKAWQASVTDEDLRKTILLGGQGVGKSPTMPGQPQLQGKPEVVDALVKMIREFGK